MILGVDEQAVEITHAPNLFLKCLRGISGLSIAEFARKVDMSIEMVKKMESGSRIGLPEMWERIARSMGIEMVALAENLCEAATDLIGELSEDIAIGDDHDVRLYYVIGATGKLWICDLDYFDEPTEGDKFIVATPSEGLRMLENQKKELGS